MYISSARRQYASLMGTDPHTDIELCSSFYNLQTCDAVTPNSICCGRGTLHQVMFMLLCASHYFL